LGVDARATGMGEAYTAVSDDISAIFWNPAGLVLQTGIQAMYSRRVSQTFHSGKWTEYPDYNFFAASMYNKYGAIGINISYLYQEIDDWTGEGSFGPSVENFTTSDLAAGLTYSNQLTEQLSIGITGKYIREKIDTFVAEGHAIDLGLLYKPGYKNIAIGITAKNLGPEMRFRIDEDADGLYNEDPFDLIDNDGDGYIDEDREEKPFKIPRNFSLGVAGDVYRQENICLLASMQIDNDFEFNESSSLGTEFQYEILRLRCGIKMDDDGYAFNRGLGVRFSVTGIEAAIDYSYSETSSYEDSDRLETHNISVKLLF
ncbi:MAG: PorV/PorQ family protein, partial [Candidatus Methanoperedens sp.]